MIYAVTAVSGQLGREIALKLIDKFGASNVIGLARTPTRVDGLGVEVRLGDYDKPDDLRASLQGVDALVLLSGMAPPEDRIQQHRNVIEAAKSAGVRKIIYTSIQGPDENTAFSPVVQSNRQTEADVRASGLDWAIGRNGIYIEPVPPKLRGPTPDRTRCRLLSVLEATPRRPLSGTMPMVSSRR